MLRRPSRMAKPRPVAPPRLVSGKSSADHVTLPGTLRDVTMAPLHVASFDRRRPQAPALFARATVENHIPTLVRVYKLEIQVSFWLGARHDED